MTEPKKADTIADLQKALVDVLTLPQLDFTQLVDISTRLSRLDPDYVRFASDSGLIDRLGQELVARQETAVSELVKNAYDADARELQVTFVDAESAGGSLRLVDDGNGMTRDQLINGFMRLASTEKQAFPVSPLYRRARAGRKGIGRFSAQRLGARLELVTQTADAAHAWKLCIDWRKFASGTDLHQVATRIEVVPKERPKGTTLNILGLRDRWSDAQISRVFRYVEELLDPFPYAGPTSGSAPDRADADPGFKAVFLRRTESEERLVASEDRMVLEHAIAKIHAEVDQDGKAWTTLVSDRLGLNETEPLRINDSVSQTTFPHLRKVKLDAHYFIYETDLMPSQVRGRLQRLGSEQGGFRLYRNGFRVLPYGERRNDWLGLDEQSRRRAILPAIANSNWLGAISIVDPEHDVFFEVSSREGLAMNAAMSELIQFGLAVAVKCATRVASIRGRKVKAGSRSQRSPQPRPPTPEALREAAADLRSTPDGRSSAPDTADSGPSDGHTAADGSAQEASGATASEPSKRVVASQLLVAAADQIEEQSKEIEMLRVLSSLGLVVATFTHEARNRVMSMRDLLELLLSDPSLPEASLRRVVDLRAATNDLKSYLGYFENSLSEMQRRELEQQDVSALLYEFVRAFKPISDRWNITIETYIDEGLVTKPMLASEWSSILTNLFTNSVKAIKRAERDRGQILIRAARVDGWIQVDFVDNGDGIAREHWDRIFDPFFTLSATAHDDDLTGMGLGLKIVKDTVTSRNGQVFVVEPPANFHARMRVKIPADQHPTP
ncbi:MAG TPA: sensor histidine kinase [Methylibium sp.]|nr:sensor histidine kinase [Methylibium sp.]